MNSQLSKVAMFLANCVKIRKNQGANDPLTFPYICDNCGGNKFEILRASREGRKDQNPGYKTIAILYCDNCGEAIIINVLSLMFRLNFDELKQTNGENVEYFPDERHIHDNCISTCTDCRSPSEQQCISDNWV